MFIKCNHCVMFIHMFSNFWLLQEKIEVQKLNIQTYIKKEKNSCQIPKEHTRLTTSKIFKGVLGRLEE